jgi:hypothetical protein
MPVILIGVWIIAGGQSYWLVPQSLRSPVSRLGFFSTLALSPFLLTRGHTFIQTIGLADDPMRARFWTHQSWHDCAASKMEACFVAKDGARQKLAYVYYGEKSASGVSHLGPV